MAIKEDGHTHQLEERHRMKSHVDPTKETFAAFRSNDRAGPIQMINLVRFHEKAAYPDGRNATGAEAYAAYGRDSHPVFSRLGGRIVWRGNFELMLIGPVDERWDECFIAEYPSVAAFVEMIREPVYREAVKHRQAAVLDSRLIRLAPAAAGSGFGGSA
jgi:uncharacterized protein (DUF1330 family)